jgi:hypothetical protein
VDGCDLLGLCMVQSQLKLLFAEHAARGRPVDNFKIPRLP